MTWVAVCRVDQLTPERGVCAVVDGRQVALILTHDGSLFAVGNRDPFSGAFVMSRGIVGSRVIDGEEVPTLASPLFKQVFDLRTGECLDGDARLDGWQARTNGGVIEVSPMRASREAAASTRT